jgi:hypothetical protein
VQGKWPITAMGRGEEPGTGQWQWNRKCEKPEVQNGLFS